MRTKGDNIALEGTGEGGRRPKIREICGICVTTKTSESHTLAYPRLPIAYESPTNGLRIAYEMGLDFFRLVSVVFRHHLLAYTSPTLRLRYA